MGCGVWGGGMTLAPVGVRLGVSIQPSGGGLRWLLFKSCGPAAFAHGRLENAHLGTALDTRSPAAGGAGMELQERNIPQFYMAWYVFRSTFCSFVTSAEMVMTVGWIFRNFKLRKTDILRLSEITVALVVNFKLVNKLKL